MQKFVLLLLAMGLASVLASGVAVAAIVTGTNGHDRLVGTSRADTIRGRAGDDRLIGRGGDDTILGQHGLDDLFGKSGNDELSGGWRRDDLFGGSGPDELSSGLGRDDAFGGKGNDTIYLRDGMRDQVDCGPGFDTVFLDPVLDTAEPGADPVTGNCEVFNP